MKFANLLPEAPSSLAELEITGITSDSSKVKAGFVFIALKGEKTDGTKFIPQAIANGAVAIITSSESGISNTKSLLIENPRLALAKMAATFYERQPENIVAITGTDGKTSTADFFRQLIFLQGKKSVSIGTIGVISGEGNNIYNETLTTPDPVELQRLLAEISNSGVQYVAMEASSHGLSQYRLDGVNLQAAAFTNIARDHLDYHKTEEAYFLAKSRLFAELLPEGKTAVLNQDDKKFSELKEICEKRKHKIIGFGRNGAEFTINSITPHQNGQAVSLTLFGKKYEISVPLIGEFQVMNILAALGLTVGCGMDLEKTLNNIKNLKNVSGRLEQVLALHNGAAVFIDYAHTPMALENILKTLRPHTQNKLHIVFGCGGDRDTGKRPIMGKIASEFADYVIVTDDNPRNENPATIRANIMAGCTGGAICKEIADRVLAISLAIEQLGAGDILVIAGKGHEKIQIIGDKHLAFNDGFVARAAMANHAMHVEIDSRKIQAGDLFVAIKGERVDGHDYVGDAFTKGAIAAVVGARTLQALEDLGKYKRNHSSAKVIGITGSVGKTSTKEMLKLALSVHGKTYATTGNYNNHIGTPLNLANLPLDAEFAVFEMGMNHAGEIAHLTNMVRPHIALITGVEAVHLEFFTNIEEIAKAKAEIFLGLEKSGIAIINDDQSYFKDIPFPAITFGESEKADCHLLSYKPTISGCEISASIMGKRIDYILAATGQHWAIVSLSVLAVIHALDLDVQKSAQALAKFSEVEGRGRIERINNFWLINDSYNASPASMSAAFIKTNEVWQAQGKKGRKIAILGDMLELGVESPKIHAKLAKNLHDAGFDEVYTAGDLMQNLYTALPPALQAGHARNYIELLAIIKLQADDVVLVKGSHGSLMYELAEELKKKGFNKNAI